MATTAGRAVAKTVAKVTHRIKGNIGTTIDDLWALREKKRLAEETVKDIEIQIAAATEVLFDTLDQQGLDKATGSKASVSISTAVSAQVEDWDALNAYVKKTGHFHLYQKRLSDVAYRELLEQGKKVPGVQPFSKRKLNLRTV